MTLRDVLDDVATEEGVTGEVVEGGSTAWSGERGPFAILSADGSSVSFHLDEQIAAAAWRTPDASSSDRGPDWVDFDPRELDDHAIDRLTAWFAAAARRSAGPGSTA